MCILRKQRWGEGGGASGRKAREDLKSQPAIWTVFLYKPELLDAVGGWTKVAEVNGKQWGIIYIAWFWHEDWKKTAILKDVFSKLFRWQNIKWLLWHKDSDLDTTPQIAKGEKQQPWDHNGRCTQEPRLCFQRWISWWFMWGGSTAGSSSRGHVPYTGNNIKYKPRLQAAAAPLQV